MHNSDASVVNHTDESSYDGAFPSCRLSVAPMLDWTDRHCRYFHRLMSEHTQLYSEMVTTGAIIHGKGDFLAYNEQEHPLVLQLGGSNPADLATCAKLAQARGYDEINLNVGCPSDRVQNGRFGACLMAEPELVAQCIAAMREVVDIPVTVKTRIGIDDQDSYAFLTDFVGIVSEKGGCEQFTIHARKAWLSGLSPKENREIPPLDYPRAYQLKQDFAHLTIAVNGGVKSLEEAKSHLAHLDGVMIGREAYQNPYILASVDQTLFGATRPVIKRRQVVEAMYPYIETQLSNGSYLGHISRHMIGLFQNMPGARQWRRHISENAHKPGAGIEVLEQALAKIPSELDV
ncbi:tRNA dihydrouridine(20/20a) synthase DusA [Vibrio sp. SM6]|uniref:tRNA-dihydrouridine(20/20a) synthase n=1 Tax=Vibrio agarilyticus TaxID=2726741 RepID=A0A7X8YH79_9VIBR|nr:tRNA dihydrouridine(20/20a) synthase DusA [Vibrio agarilyticus]NLS13464.1 tRNA dihydrouridine(20/20a) synthase DusA [Vibrio agarilyticus]